jgi:hypothetical protein
MPGAIAILLLLVEGRPEAVLRFGPQAMQLPAIRSLRVPVEVQVVAHTILRCH